MPLTHTQAMRLLVATTDSKPSAWCDSGGTVHYGQCPPELKGGFEGRAGSLTRSRKGAVRRKLDGSRKYDPFKTTAKWYSA